MVWHVIPWYGEFTVAEQDHYNTTLKDIGENGVLWKGFRPADVTQPPAKLTQWAWGTKWRHDLA